MAENTKRATLAVTENVRHWCDLDVPADFDEDAIRQHFFDLPEREQEAAETYQDAEWGDISRVEEKSARAPFHSVIPGDRQTYGALTR